MAVVWPMMSFGNISDFKAQSSECATKVKRAVQNYKNVQQLLDIADSFKSLPNECMQQILSASITHSGNGVSETFFNQPSENAVFGEHDFTGLRNKLAVAVISKDLTNVAKFNFNHVTNGTVAQQVVEDIAHGGKELGEALMVEVLKQKHGFLEFLRDKKKWVEKLEKILEDEVYILGTLVKQLTEEKNLPIKMKFFLLKVLGSEKIKEIEVKWPVISSKKLIKPIIDFIGDDLLSFVHAWLMNQPFAREVQAACYKSHTKSWTTSFPTRPPAMPVMVDHTEVSFGDAVRSWLYSSNGPNMYGLLQPGQTPNNIVRKSHVNNPASCFLAGTAVLLSNSNTVPIEELKENDQLLCRNGELGIVSSEKVLVKLEKTTAIYGINDMEPFFTAGHPFWTQDGWRAINPHLAMEENHWLEVGQLTEGDQVKKVRKVDDEGHVEYEWVQINSFTLKDYPAGTYVYGVHTREGPRSYHANGFLVCLNYPEITGHSIIDRMSNLSSDEKNKFQSHMKDLEPILTKVLGIGPANAMKSITQKYIEEKIGKQVKTSRENIPFKDITLPHLQLHYQAGGTELGSYKMPTKMSVVRGHLFLNDTHVEDAHISSDSKITWNRKSADGKWEHGSVKLHGSGHQGHGFIALTSSRNDTKSELSANFIAAANVNKYKCYKSSEPSKAGKQTTTKWDDFGELEMGVDCSSGTCNTVGKILIPPMDTLDDLGHHVVFAVDSKQHLSVDVVVPVEYLSLLGYTKLSGTFSMDFATFSGTCISYDATKADFQGETFAWKGIVEKDLKTEALLATARNASLKNEHKLHTRLTQSVDSVAGVPQGDTVDGLSPMAETMTLLTDDHLSVDELFMITPPDPQSVHELTFSLLQEGMKYEMDSTLREEILGVVKPNLDGEMISVSNKYKDFLGNKFANAYLMNGLARSDHYKDKITEEQQNQLLYFWAGDGKGCLAQDADYNKANNDVSRIAYIKSCPEVSKYVTSNEGGTYWAKKLYNKLTQTVVLNGLALTAEVSQTMTIIQKQSMVLFCLAPSEDYGAKFYKKIMITRLNEMTSYFNGDKNDDKLMTSIITDSMHQLILKILTGTDETTKEVTANLAKQLNDAAKELNVDMTKTNEEIADEMMGHFEDMISEVITLYQLKSGTAWKKLAESVKQWQLQNPIKSGIFTFFSVAICSALWICSIYFTVKSFMDWKDLKPEQKVALIADSVDIVMRTIAGIPDLINNFKTTCQNGKVAFKFIKNKIAAGNSPEAVEQMESLLDRNVELVESVDEVGVDAAIAEATSVQLEDAAVMVTRWQKFFSVTEALAKGTGLIAGVAGCVVVGFQIYRDFATGAPVAQKALDICQGITMGVATIAAAVGLFVEAACIPIIGIVCAIVGIALAIASLFVHRDPPKPKPTKIDLYVEGTGGKFVNKLAKPSDKWLKDYHKANPDKKPKSSN